MSRLAAIDDFFTTFIDRQFLSIEANDQMRIAVKPVDVCYGVGQVVVQHRRITKAADDKIVILLCVLRPCNLAQLRQQMLEPRRINFLLCPLALDKKIDVHPAATPSW